MAVLEELPDEEPVPVQQAAAPRVEEPLPEAEPEAFHDAASPDELAAARKDAGNAAFRAGDFDEAVECYTEALEASAAAADVLVASGDATPAPPAGTTTQPQQRAVLFANRAAARLGLKDLQGCVADCDAALALDATYVKALLRRAAALEQQGELEQLERADAGVRRCRRCFLLDCFMRTVRIFSPSRLRPRAGAAARPQRGGGEARGAGREG